MRIDEIYEAHKAKDEPWCYKGQQDLKLRTLAGETGAPQRGRLRKRCSPLIKNKYLLSNVLHRSMLMKENSFRSSLSFCMILYKTLLLDEEVN